MGDKTTGAKALDITLHVLAFIGIVITAFISAILGLAKNS